MNHLFTIDSDAWRALSPDEVKHTITGLRELGLCRLPYPVVDIAIPADECADWPDKDKLPPLGEEVVILLHGVKDMDDHVELSHVTISCLTRTMRWPRAPFHQPLETQGNEKFAAWALAGLITLLATRNAVKATTRNKLARLGIGKRKAPYEYITRISLPCELPADTEHKPTGIKRCPHLRRGHIRRQHFGKGNALIKQIWIEPVFVNADEEFTRKRVGYSFNLPTMETAP